MKFFLAAIAGPKSDSPLKIGLGFGFAGGGLAAAMHMLVIPDSRVYLRTCGRIPDAMFLGMWKEKLVGSEVEVGAADSCARVASLSGFCTYRSRWCRSEAVR